MNYIDVKVTVWNRLKFSDDTDMKELANLIRINGIESVIDDEKGFQESETLFDSEVKMTLEENGLDSTIEVYQRDNLVWQNGRDSVLS